MFGRFGVNSRNDRSRHRPTPGRGTLRQFHDNGWLGRRARIAGRADRIDRVPLGAGRRLPGEQYLGGSRPRLGGELHRHARRSGHRWCLLLGPARDEEAGNESKDREQDEQPAEDPKSKPNERALQHTADQLLGILVQDRKTEVLVADRRDRDSETAGVEL